MKVKAKEKQDDGREKSAGKPKGRTSRAQGVCVGYLLRDSASLLALEAAARFLTVSLKGSQLYTLIPASVPHAKHPPVWLKRTQSVLAWLSC